MKTEIKIIFIIDKYLYVMFAKPQLQNEIRFQSYLEYTKYTLRYVNSRNF